MGRAYRTMRKKRGVCRFSMGKLEVRSHLENLGADGTRILVRNFKKWDGELMYWIGVAQVRDRWWALVNTVMKLRVPQNMGNFVTG
jgi:hypothetical protein